MGYITEFYALFFVSVVTFQSSFELTGYITEIISPERAKLIEGFKALSSLRVI